MHKLAIISTHPIQYYAPLFKMLTDRGKIDIKVFYTWPQAIQGHDDPDFGTQVKWDIPLLEGYDYQLVKNISKNPSSKNWSGIDNPTLVKDIEAYNPQAIWVFGWKLKSHFAVMRHFKGKIPVWFRGDSTLLDYEIKSIKSLVSSIKNNYHPTSMLSQLKTYGKFKLRKAFLSYIYKHIDTAFYVGKNSKDYFLAHGLKQEQLVFAPHAIDNERFFDGEEKKYETVAQDKRKVFDIKETDIVILFAGKLEAKKNPWLLLRTFLTLPDSKIQTKLIIAGSGPQESELKKFAAGNPNIIFLPFQNQTQMPITYRMADIFCLPSQGPEETWGLAVNEALACGRKVLVSDKVGCAIDLVNDKVGRVFKSGDSNDLQVKLTQLLQQKISAESCRQHITPWSFEAICVSLEKEIR